MRPMTAASGEQLFKAVHLTIFPPKGKPPVRRVQRAPAGKGISAHGVDTILADIADKIEAQWPGEEFALVPLGANRFNFVWRGTEPEQEIEAEA